MKSVGILGGGISGLFSAYYLNKAGFDVTVIDRNEFKDGCSFGNAGMIVPSHIIPLAQPGMIAKGLRWMLDAHSPFYVKPRLSWGLMKWGYLFWKHSTPEHVHRSIPVLRDISLISKQLFQDLARQQELDFGWQEKGLFMLFKAAHARDEMQEEAQVALRSGIEAHFLTGGEVQALEPHVQVEVEGAVYYPGDAHLAPHQLMTALVAYLKNNGVRLLEHQEVVDFGIRNQTVATVSTTSGSYTFDEVVVAAGAWSPALTEKLGLTLPMQGGKGYSFMASLSENVPEIPAILLEARATVTPMDVGVRFAGTLEVTGTDTTVNMNRVQGIHRSIHHYYPELQMPFPNQQEVWRGLRPCSPDGLPYIGRMKELTNVTLATGHGMMGVSLGPATGKLVTELLMGEPASMDISAFDPQRFS
jgi:D-amino-acid dehydrogenase